MSADVDIACGECGVDFCLPAPLYDALRENGKTFYCPNGHPRVFREGPKDRRIKELEGRIKTLERSISCGGERFAELWAQREDLVGEIKACPLGCGWRARRQVPRDPVAMGRGLERVERDIAEHLIAEHGARPEAQRLIPERTGVGA